MSFLPENGIVFTIFSDTCSSLRKMQWEFFFLWCNPSTVPSISFVPLLIGQWAQSKGWGVKWVFPTAVESANSEHSYYQRTSTQHSSLSLRQLHHTSWFQFNITSSFTQTMLPKLQDFFQSIISETGSSHYLATHKHFVWLLTSHCTVPSRRISYHDTQTNSRDC